MSTSDGKDAVEQAAEQVKEAAENIDPHRVATAVKVGGAILTMGVGFALIGSGVNGLWANYRAKRWPWGSQYKGGGTS